MADSLFDDASVGQRPDPVARRAVRRAVLGWVLQAVRAVRGWSVNDAASHAGIAPMTWRRMEEGLDVRRRSLTAVDTVLDVPFGTVTRALDDDLLMVELSAIGGVDISGVAPVDAAGFLDAVAERAWSGTDVRHVPNAATFAATGRVLDAAMTAMPPLSDITRAAELVEHITRRAMTPALEQAVSAILAAMPDLVRASTDAIAAATDREPARR